MAKRRSFKDGLTADQEKFLNAGKLSAKGQNPSPATNPKPKKEKPPMKSSAAEKYVPAQFAPSPVAASPAHSAPSSTLSTRIDARLSAAILRAVTERRIAQRAAANPQEYGLPATHQEIITEAMTDWLKKNGFWN